MILFFHFQIYYVIIIQSFKCLFKIFSYLMKGLNIEQKHLISLCFWFCFEMHTKEKKTYSIFNIVKHAFYKEGTMKKNLPLKIFFKSFPLQFSNRTHNKFEFDTSNQTSPLYLLTMIVGGNFLRRIEILELGGILVLCVIMRGRDN